MSVPVLAGLIGWQGAFLIIATITSLCAVAIQPLCAELDADKDNTQALSFGSGLAAPLRLVFSHRSLAVWAGVSFLLSMTQLSLTNYLVTYLGRTSCRDRVCPAVYVSVVYVSLKNKQ